MEIWVSRGLRECAPALHSFLFVLSVRENQEGEERRHTERWGSACFTGSQGWPFTFSMRSQNRDLWRYQWLDTVSLRNQRYLRQGSWGAVQAWETSQIPCFSPWLGLKPRWTWAVCVSPQVAMWDVKSRTSVSDFVSVLWLPGWSRFLFKVNNHWPLFLKGQFWISRGEYMKAFVTDKATYVFQPCYYYHWPCKLIF